MDVLDTLSAINHAQHTFALMRIWQIHGTWVHMKWRKRALGFLNCNPILADKKAYVQSIEKTSNLDGLIDNALLHGLVSVFSLVWFWKSLQSCLSKKSFMQTSTVKHFFHKVDLKDTIILDQGIPL